MKHATFLSILILPPTLLLQKIDITSWSVLSMSRPSTFGQRDVNSNSTTAAQRNLTLTEELEKLEQSITLTLQGDSISAAYQRLVSCTNLTS